MLVLKTRKFQVGKKNLFFHQGRFIKEKYAYYIYIVLYLYYP